jgi:ATP-binding cassette subfamily C protein LapB
MEEIKYKGLYKDHWFFGPILKHKKFYIRVMWASAFINVFALVSAFYVMIVYDRIIPNNATESLIVLTVGVLAIVAFDFAMKVLRGLYTDKASSLVDIEVSENLFDRISRNEQLIGQKTGAIASVVKEFDSLKEFIASASFVAFVDLPFIFLFLFVLYSIGGFVAAVPALIVVVVIVMGLLIQPIIQKLTFNASKDGQSKQSVIVEVLSGMETLKTLPGIGILRDRWVKSVESQGVTTAKSKFWSQLTSNFTQSGQQLSQVGIIVYGVFLIAEGDLTMGSLIACVILSGRTLAPLGQVSSLLGRYNQAITSYENFGQLMQQPVTEMSREHQIRVDKVTGALTIKNVSLTYPGMKEPTVRQLNLDIKAGEKVAIVGKIGSGKTSLLRLIAGLLQASEGSVKIDQTDISHMHGDDLRKHVGVVMQMPMLFSGTLKENLLMGNPDATDDEVLYAAKVAGVDEIASNLPDGYETVLQENGQQLSGGQRQAVCIARCFVGNPQIIIMDEPSSAMDNGSESQLLLDIQSRIVDKTFILITHRGTLLSLVDRVMVFDSGRIVADGPKDEILKAMQTPTKKKAPSKKEAPKKTQVNPEEVVKKTKALVDKMAISKTVQNYSFENVVFDMHDSTGKRVGGAEDVTGTFVIDTAISTGVATFASVTPFFGDAWTVHDAIMTITGKTTATINMLFDWGSNSNIAVVLHLDIGRDANGDIASFTSIAGSGMDNGPFAGFNATFSGFTTLLTTEAGAKKTQNKSVDDKGGKS